MSDECTDTCTAKHDHAEDRYKLRTSAMAYVPPHRREAGERSNDLARAAPRAERPRVPFPGQPHGSIPTACSCLLGDPGHPVRHTVECVSAREVQDRIETIKRGVDEGKIDDSESAQINALAGPRAATYGEITAKGFSKLARRLEIGPSDRFADLGSGIGRTVVQAVTEFDVAYAYGVEISPTRHARAMAGRQALGTEVSERVGFGLADCCESSEWAEGGGVHDATVVWACSLLFGDPLIERISELVTTIGRVRAVASLKRFPGGIIGFTEQRPPEQCEMSWTVSLDTDMDHSNSPPGVPVYIYCRDSSLDGYGVATL